MITGKAWDDINTLISFLKGASREKPFAVQLYDRYFLPFDNPAPGRLLLEQIEIIEQHLREGSRDE